MSSHHTIASEHSEDRSVMSSVRACDGKFYIAFIHADDEPGYGISFPDFMGCISAGDTLEEAFTMAEEALNGHIGVMMDHGDVIPTPRSVAEVMSDPELEEIRQDVRYIVYIPVAMSIAQAAE